MLGGLYGDLPPPSSTSGAAEDNRAAASASAVWSSSAKMAPATLRKPLAPPSSLLKPRVQSKPSSFAPNPSTHVGNHAVRDEAGKIQSLQPALVAITTSVVEEYDPGRPNAYEDYRREKKRRAVEAEVKRELDRKRREEEERERERERERREREEAEAEAEAEAAREVEARAALNITGEEAWKRRAALGGAPPRSPSPPQATEGEGFSIGKSKSVGLGVGAGGQMTAAQRMMARMGWKEGQGLGKQEQGITTPLMAKKTDRRAGVIVNASEAKPEGKKPKSVNFNGPPTRVLLLRNMVGPGDVDDELEEEVGSECAKYGLVTRVLIFEITEPNFPAEEAVRIFIQFERSEWTTKALIDLDGRYFGGRIVKATFYDEERFSRNELAPMPGEIPGFF